MKKEVLCLENVSKTIKGRNIVKSINFTINEGEILGFLGPNGAGKSTTLRMIVGLSRPTEGTIHICGHSITKNYIEAMSQVGCIIEGPDLYSYMNGKDNLEMLAAMGNAITDSDIMRAVKLVGMQHRIKDKISTYSLGMKQRLGLAQALIHRPKLLILDEPTNGLDPAGIQDFRNIIRKLACEENISVLISSHLLSEIELMCDKVVIIKNGSIIKHATVKELTASQEIVWVLDDYIKGKDVLENLWGIQGNILENGLEAIIDLSLLPKINTSFLREGLQLKFVHNKHKTLEDLFLDLTENKEII